MSKKHKNHTTKLTHAGHVLTDVASVEECIKDLYDNHGTVTRAPPGTMCSSCNFFCFDVDTNIAQDMENAIGTKVPAKRLNLCRYCLPCHMGAVDYMLLRKQGKKVKLSKCVKRA